MSEETQVLEWTLTYAGDDDKAVVNEFNQQSNDYEIVFLQPDKEETYVLELGGAKAKERIRV